MGLAVQSTTSGRRPEAWRAGDTVTASRLRDPAVSVDLVLVAECLSSVYWAKDCYVPSISSIQPYI
jgi:hypothetical protein